MDQLAVRIQYKNVRIALDFRIGGEKFGVFISLAVIDAQNSVVRI